MVYKDGSYIYDREWHHGKIEDIETVKLAKVLYTKLDLHDNADVYCTRDIFNDSIGISGYPAFQEGAWCFLKDGEVLQDDMRNPDDNIRWEYSNQIQADILISLHFNGTLKHQTRGSEVLINGKNARSLQAASQYFDYILKWAPEEYITKRRVTNAMNKVGIITYSHTDAMLFEPLYMDNKEDNSLMTLDMYCTISDAIIHCLIGVFGLNA